MSFMEKQIHRGDGWIADTDNGSVAIPDWNAPDVDKLREQIGKIVWLGELRGTLISIEYIPDAWWGRYSAPGYMDCTEWMWSTESREDLEKELDDVYGTDEEEDEEGQDDA